MSTMLVVEDDPATAEVLSYQIGHAGHEVLATSDGAEALRLLREQEVDLVLLDLMLPSIPGLDVLRMIRQEQPVPVIIISARGSEADKVTGLKQGADDYISKPFSVRELLARVEAVLRRNSLLTTSPAERAPVIEVDQARHEVRRRGEPVRLSPKEFELLAHLVRHRNRVCSRESILDAVWGYGYDGDTRTVDVHMHWLRQKLEGDPSHPDHLVTVRHYGYKFVPEPAPAPAPTGR